MYNQRQRKYLVNILPWRDWRLKRKNTLFYRQVGVVVFCIMLIIIAWVWVIQGDFSIQNARNNLLKKSTLQFQSRLHDLKQTKTSLKQISARLNSIRDVQNRRGIVIQLIDELARIIPDGTYLQKLTLKTGGAVFIKGISDSSSQIAKFVDNFKSSAVFGEAEIGRVYRNTSLNKRGNTFSLTTTVPLLAKNVIKKKRLRSRKK